MSRAERWWRPAGQRRNTRPAIRSARRGRYAAAAEYLRGYDQAQEDAWKAFDEADAFELGYRAGQADERKRSQRRDDLLHRLADAADAAALGDPTALADLSAELDTAPSGDDFLEVADAAGITPLPEVDGEQLVDELEAWLRRQG